MSKIIMGVQLLNRMDDAPKFQELLSKYGCFIQTRIGLHPASPDFCKPDGVVILDFLENSDEEVKKFEDEMSAYPNIIVRKMVF